MAAPGAEDSKRRYTRGQDLIISAPQISRHPLNPSLSLTAGPTHDASGSGAAQHFPSACLGLNFKPGAFFFLFLFLRPQVMNLNFKRHMARSKIAREECASQAQSQASHSLFLPLQRPFTSCLFSDPATADTWWGRNQYWLSRAHLLRAASGSSHFLGVGNPLFRARGRCGGQPAEVPQAQLGHSESQSKRSQRLHKSPPMPVSRPLRRC